MFKKLLPMLVALTALPVGATTVYTSFSSMASANAGLTFSAVDFTTGSGLLTGLYTSADGVAFQSDASYLSTTGSASGGWSGLTLRSNGGASITITLPTGATAFGGRFGGTSGTWGDIMIAAVGNTTESLTISYGSPQYAGFVSTIPFSSITLSVTAGNTLPALNNFVFGMPMSSGGPGGGGPGDGGPGGDPGPATTPEPSSMALMGAALIAIPLWARRRHRK